MTELTVKIPIRNADGHVVGEKEVVSYAGLLGRAHSEGLRHITTAIIQMPTKDNGMFAVVRAVVEGKVGTFTGIGDASPESVNRKVARHILRMAETRAKARALRDYTNIGMVALEELGGDDELDVDAAQAPANGSRYPNGHATAQGDRSNRRSSGITDAQKRMLWRQALSLGYEGNAATSFLRDRLGLEPERATKDLASRVISELETEIRQLRGQGDHAAE